MTDERDRPAGDPIEDFFDSSFLSELEELAAHEGPRLGPQPASGGLQEKLSAFLAPPSGLPESQSLTEEVFAGLPPAALAERTNALIETFRQVGRSGAAQAVESFVVFFQALLPTVAEEGSQEVRRVFFHLVPTLIHIAFSDFGNSDEKREEGRAALRGLEDVLLEISSVRLAPTESELVFRSIDQMAAFIGVGEYAMASEVISSQLLSIISRNKLTRALYRLMEVEVNIQRYLNEKFGHPTPQIRVPEDLPRLRAYGPIRVLEEHGPEGAKLFIQVQLPDIAILRDVVLHLVSNGEMEGRDLRLDAVGTAELSVPPGTYRIGLVYQPGG